MVGGLVRAFVNRKIAVDASIEQRGVLLASGLIGGDACTGIIIAGLAITRIIPTRAQSLTPFWVSFAAYALLALYLGLFAIGRRKRS